VSCFASFNDGTGPALYIGGNFVTAGAVTAPGIVRWNGSDFTTLGAGASGPVGSLAAAPPPLGALYAGGPYTSMNNMQVAHLGVWEGCPCYANCDMSTAVPVLNVNDYLCFLNRFAISDPYANCDSSTTPPVLNVNDFICFLIQYSVGCP
jgi:hypothetical protein